MKTARHRINSVSRQNRHVVSRREGVTIVASDHDWRYLLWAYKTARKGGAPEWAARRLVLFTAMLQGRA